eukprot:CAMPEP_0202980168 /NCGR_PEP_ID=MMETSP1396-20130829/86139_1 /ASSEMBLY_ACC=CAM_ASM_000872 /TAXON_ID= /ORGANISM="Pseudokeronopsis sp., Strain Brazil" /LENGTH=104 /DNA_ID=CAMNT_0049719961 /DNA_START=40 /DNA_END=354 /DNA_ORIENTATION=+
MDEVDGVGAGDRGGINALIQIIKETRTPIICICNDRQSPKVQSLANYCYDLKFQRPAKEVILARMRRICFAEKLNTPDHILDKIAESAGCDIRPSRSSKKLELQ